MENPITTASILGGKAILGEEIADIVSLEKIVIKGLPYQSLEILIKRIYPNEHQKLYDIIPQSVWNLRRQSGYLTQEESEKTARIAMIYALMLEVWESEEYKARWFMQTPHPLLEQRTPFQAIKTELGARRVEQILYAIEYGVCL